MPARLSIMMGYFMLNVCCAANVSSRSLRLCETRPKLYTTLRMQGSWVQTPLEARIYVILLGLCCPVLVNVSQYPDPPIPHPRSPSEPL